MAAVTRPIWGCIFLIVVHIHVCSSSNDWLPNRWLVAQSLIGWPTAHWVAIHQYSKRHIVLNLVGFWLGLQHLYCDYSMCYTHASGSYAVCRKPQSGQSTAPRNVTGSAMPCCAGTESEMDYAAPKSLTWTLSSKYLIAPAGDWDQVHPPSD